MKQFELKPTTGFELLNKWEASAFASPNDERQIKDLDLATQRRMFKIDFLYIENYLRLIAHPQLFWRGKEVDLTNFDAYLFTSSKLIGQYETEMGYMVVLALNHPAIFLEWDVKWHWKMSFRDMSHIFPVLGANNHLQVLFFDHGLKVHQAVTILNRWAYIYPPKHDPQTRHRQFMVDGIEYIRNGGDRVTIGLYKGPELSLTVRDYPVPLQRRLSDDGANPEVTFSPFNRFMSTDWAITVISELAYLPVHVTLHGWESNKRTIKRWFQPRPKIAKLDPIDQFDGYLNYQADEED